MNEKGYKNRNFIIAEILACITFILNIICVVTAKEIHGPWAPSWLPDFGLVYWFKTFLAIVGLFSFFKSKVFVTRAIPRYVSILTLIILWYSIPVVNLFLQIPLELIFYMIYSIKHPEIPAWSSYKVRILIQIIWSIPVFIVLIDLLARLVKNYKK